MSKLRKSFRRYEDLSEASSAIDVLLDHYKPNATLADILRNVQENELKWEACPECNSGGYTLTPKKAWSPFSKIVVCPTCKGVGTIRKKKGES